MTSDTEYFSEKTPLLRSQRPESVSDGHRSLVWPGPGHVRPTPTAQWGMPLPSERSRARPASGTERVAAAGFGGLMYFLVVAGLLSLGGLFYLEFAQSPAPYVRKVAIIGGGPAGASAAYNVRKYANQKGISVDITLFEKSDYFGGRSTCRIIPGDGIDEYNAVQIAAKGFHAVDKNLVNTVNELAMIPVMLDGKEDTDLSGRSGDRWGVFDGWHIVYRQSHPTNFLTGWWWSLKLYFFYGYSPKNTRTTVSRTQSKLNRIHSPLFFPFTSITSVIRDLDLIPETTKTGAQLLSENGVSAAFQKDLVNAWTRRDFSQNIAQISGLAAMTAPDDGGDMTVRGGHWKLFEEMVSASGAEAALNTTAFGLRKMDWGGWVVAAQKAGEEDGDYQEFDSVILAAPYQFSNLEVKGQPLAYEPQEIEYVPVHVTLFRSPRLLSRRYFDHNDAVPETILTTLGSSEFGDRAARMGTDGVGKVGFYSVTSVQRMQIDIPGSIPREEFVYKVVSPKRVPDELLYELLGASYAEDDAITWSYRHEWKSAYPYIYPRTEFSELKLDENFWYTGGIEELSSSMEMSSLMGANVAKLVVDEWAKEGRGRRPERRFDEAEDGEETLYPETVGSYLKSQYEGTWDEEHKPVEEEE